jgi:hypothetical protein
VYVKGYGRSPSYFFAFGLQAMVRGVYYGV